MSIIQWKQTEINLLCKCNHIILALLIVLIGFNVTWAEFDNPAAWEIFDLGVNDVGLDPNGNVNGAFDGRYIYFAPARNNPAYHAEVLRYDTWCEFSDPNCWTTFDYGKAIGDPDIAGYTYVLYDGSRYLYFNPWYNNDDPHGNVLRHDTWGEFTEPNAWSSVNLENKDSSCKGFGGLAFDDNYIYMPTWNDLQTDLRMVRYDVNEPFNNLDSWEVAKWNEARYNLVSPVFDGKYVYFAPFQRQETIGRVYIGAVLRYDTTDSNCPFDYNSPCWEVFYADTALNENLTGFVGTAYDNQYVYFVTWRGMNIPEDYNSLILRYDTNLGFNEPDSWEFYESNDVYVEIVYDDERYLYFTPRNDVDATGQFLRFDTTKDFDDTNAWKYFDPGENGVGDNLKNYHGGVSDGHYVYFAPWEIGGNIHGEILRYDSKYEPPSLDPLVLSPNGGESWIASTTQDIEWSSDANIPEVKIEYSVNNGQDWNDVDVNTVPNSGVYEWLVPEVTSKECLVRISDVNDPNIYDVSDDVFTIFECLGPIPGDLNNDCYNNGKDLAILAAHWLGCGNPLDPACGIVAYWNFDEGTGNIVHDISLNANHGTIHGATWVDGVSGKALEFDGSNRVIIPNSYSLNPSKEITVETWVKLNRIAYGTGYSGTDAQFLICKGGDRTPGAYILGQWGDSPSSSFFAFEIAPFWLDQFASTPLMTLETNRWYQAAGTYDGTTLKIYIDGALQGSKDIGSVQIGNSNPLYLSYNDVVGFPFYLDGSLDEVRIYNRALTDTEIEYLYNSQ